MSLDSLHWLFQWGSIWLVAATFVFGAGALITGSRLADRQASRMLALETELSRQQERAAAAELALRKLEEATAPRSLSENQRGLIVAALAGKPPGSIELLLPGSDHEAEAFGRQIGEVLSEAGWSVNVLTAIVGFSGEGVQVQQETFGVGLPATVAIFEALKAAGLDPSTGVDPKLKGGGEDRCGAQADNGLSAVLAQAVRGTL